MSAKYHPGEIEVQKRAGMRPRAERVCNSIHSSIPHAAREFLEEQLMVVGSVDADGRVWVSLLVGEPGFVRVLDERTMRIATTPLPGDPVEEILQGRARKRPARHRASSRRGWRLSNEAEKRPDASTCAGVRTTPTALNTTRSVSHAPAEAGG